MNKKEILISFFIPSLRGGGAEKVVLNLVNSFAGKGFKVDLILIKATGPYLIKVSKSCRIVDLKSKRALFSLNKLIQYLHENKPFVLISNMSHLNVLSLIASFFACVPTKLVIVEHNNLSETIRNSRGLSSRFVSFLMLLTYRSAYKVVAVSKGVAEDLEHRIRYLKGKVIVIYNPVNISEIFEMQKEPLDCPWFNNKGIPVILSVGRLALQKDYQALLKAFSIVRKKLDSHLIILGEGEERENLVKLAKDLGISDDIWMPGFVDNPYKYMSRGNVFVLSSRYEGFGNVVVEAMACGTPIVATDCPSGPGEILDNGKYGRLVSVGDVEAMADAILEVLEKPVSSEVIKSRAKEFGLDKTVLKYLEVIENAGKL